MRKITYVSSDRIDTCETGAYGCDSKQGAIKGIGAVRACRVRRGLVLHSVGWSPATWTPFGTVFGRAGIARSGRRSIGAVRRQRESSLLAVADRTSGDNRPLRSLRTTCGCAHSYSKVVRGPWAPVLRYFLGDLRSLGRELEYRFVKDTHRYFLFASRSGCLTRSDYQVGVGRLMESRILIFCRSRTTDLYGARARVKKQPAALVGWISQCASSSSRPRTRSPAHRAIDR